MTNADYKTIDQFSKKLVLKATVLRELAQPTEGTVLEGAEEKGNWTLDRVVISCYLKRLNEFGS